MASNTKSIDLESGSSQYLSITDGSQSGLDPSGDMSLMGWIRRESVGSFTGIMTKRGSGNGGYIFYFEDDSQIVFSYINTSGTDDVIYSTDATYTSTDWFHLAVTVDISAKAVLLYVNGSPVAGSYTRQNATAIGNTTAPFWLGAMNSGDTPNNFFDGKMDEIGFYDAVLSAGTILADYNSGDGTTRSASETNIVSGWRFEDDLLDITATDNDLSAPNGSAYSTDVPFVGDLILIVETMALTLTFNAILLKRGLKLIVATLSLVLTFNAILLKRALKFIVDTLAMTLTFNDIILTTAKVYKLVVDTLALTLTFNAILFRRAVRLVVDTLTMTLTFNDINLALVRAYKLVIDTMSLTLTFFQICLKGPTRWVNAAKNSTTWGNISKNTTKWINKCK